MIASYDPHAHCCPQDCRDNRHHFHDGRDDLLAALLDLTARGVHVRVVDPADYIDPCGVCPEDLDQHTPPAEAVATVRATLASGFTYLTPVCAEHLAGEVDYERRPLRHHVVVQVPNGDPLPARAAA